jgi:5-methylcytosine-specific restriction endonuclease McrA
MSLIVQEHALPLDMDFLMYSYEDWLKYSEQNYCNYPYIKTIKHNIIVPEIIVLRKFNRLPQRDVKYSRQTLFERDKFRCGYCGRQFMRSELTLDHIIPKSQGGKKTWSNSISACYDCNSKKADRTPEQAGMKLKFQPHKPGWFSPIANIGPNHPRKSWIRFSGIAIED